MTRPIIWYRLDLPRDDRGFRMHDTLIWIWVQSASLPAYPNCHSVFITIDEFTMHETDILNLRDVCLLHNI